MTTLLIVILVLLALGGLPQLGGVWHGHGYGPSGLLAVLLIILVVLALTGRL